MIRGARRLVAAALSVALYLDKWVALASLAVGAHVVLADAGVDGDGDRPRPAGAICKCLHPSASYALV